MLFERIKKLTDQKKMTIAELERKLDFGQGSISKWKNQSPSSERVGTVADFFNVTTDYLLGRTDKPNAYLNGGQTVTIEEALDSVMSYDGKPLTDNERDVLKGIVKAYLNSKE